MKTKIASQFTSLTVCVTILFAPLSYAADTPPTPPTKTGGGGGSTVPPKGPPTKYFSGGGDAASNHNGQKPVHSTFEVYQLDPVRNPIYYEGMESVAGQDSTGKEIKYQRVFQFLQVNTNSVGSAIRRGHLIPDSAYIDSPRIEWSPNQYTLGEMMMEVAKERSDRFRRTVQLRGVIAAKPGAAFELYKIAPDGFDVYFEGKADAQGRQKVFRNTLNSAYIDRGYIEYFEQGHIEWTHKNVPRSAAVEEISRAILKDAPRGIQQTIADADAKAAEWAKANPKPRATQYPNYPEVKNADKSPLPRNRAPVITDGKTTEGSPYQRTNPPKSGSGQAEVSSPYRTTLQPFNEQYGELWKQGRPSNLEKHLEWSGAKGQRLKKAVKHYWEGGSVQEASRSVGRGAVDLSKTSFNFYMVIGLMAGYELAMNYADNPRAWTAFLETGTDPVFYLSMGAFVAASEPFFRKMGPLNGPAGHVLPRFTGAIVAGGIASHLVNQILTDPNFRKCYGFTSFSEQGSFIRDYEACDKLYDRFANYQLDNEFAPLITNLMTTAPIVWGSLRGLSWFTQRAAVQTAMGQVVRVFKIPPAGIAKVKDLRIIGIMAFFYGVYELNSHYIGLGEKISENFLKYNPDLQYPLRATYDFLAHGVIKSYIHEHGNSLDDSEKKILKEWKRIQNGKFKNPYVWEKMCIDTKRNYQVMYNCDAPDQVDFDAVVKRYAENQKGWREAKMKPTMDVFGTWTRKVQAYNGTVAWSYVFYKALLKLKADSLKKGEKEFVMDEKTIAAMRELMNGLTKTLPVDFKQSWTYVMPRDFFDFMIASAVCGPEAESFGQTGTLGSIYHSVYGTSPKVMAADSVWSDIQFFPPRIVQPLPGNANICDKPYQGARFIPNPLDLIPGINTKGMWPVDKFPYSKHGPNETWGQAFSGSGHAQGLDKYLMDNFRDSILDEKGEDRFDEWWQQHVIEPQLKLQAEFRKEYEKMLNKRYKPALEDKRYTWCEANTNDLKISSLQKHLRTLGARTDCTPEATHRLAVGIFNSLEDEMRLYSALLLDLHENISGKPNKDLQDTLLATQDLLEDLQTYLTTINRSERGNVAELQKRWAEIRDVLKQQNAKLTSGESADWQLANSHVNLWTETLLDQIGGVIFQSAEYAKILINFEVMPKPEEKPAAK